MISNVVRFLCIGAFLAATSFNASAADATDAAALHAADSAWEKAYNSGNVEGVVGLYDAAAVLLPPGAPPAKGREAIHAFFAKATAESAKAGVHFVLGAKPDGGASGPLGWASGTYEVKDKSGKVIETGKYLSVSRKVGGKWLYVRDTWNADGVPPAAQQPAMPKKK